MCTLHNMRPLHQMYLVYLILQKKMCVLSIFHGIHEPHRKKSITIESASPPIEFIGLSALDTKYSILIDAVDDIVTHAVNFSNDAVVDHLPIGNADGTNVDEIRK